jgi:hypothetical protein
MCISGSTSWLSPHHRKTILCRLMKAKKPKSETILTVTFDNATGSGILQQKKSPAFGRGIEKGAEIVSKPRL